MKEVLSGVIPTHESDSKGYFNFEEMYSSVDGEIYGTAEEALAADRAFVEQMEGTEGDNYDELFNPREVA